MDSPTFRFPPSPGMPLFPVSPERLNIASFYELPDSPTRSPRQKREASDVHGMVARFNSLDIKDHAELRKKDEAALRRAQIGREEAEGEARSLKADSQRLEKELEDAKERERKVMKRLDVVMEDLHRTKEAQSQSRVLYEKEIRRAKKEAFKSSSAMVKLQEELKAARIALRAANSDRDLEKVKVGKRDQEVFKAQYQLVGTQEEFAHAQAKLQDASARIKIVEEERDALKQNLKEEEVARIAAEGRIALPLSMDDEHESSSLKKESRTSALPPPMCVHEVSNANDLRSFPAMEELEEELMLQTRKAAFAEAQVDFMKMECQFGCCSCQVADQQSLAYIFDDSFDYCLPALRSTKTESSWTGKPGYNTVVKSVSGDPNQDPLTHPVSPAIRVAPTGKDTLSAAAPSVSPVSRSHSPFAKQPPCTPRTASVRTKDLDEENVGFSQKTAFSTTPPSPRDQDMALGSMDIKEDIQLPVTPAHSEMQSLTGIRVPLRDDDGPTQDFSAFQSPGNLSREEAIEQIRQRRGRARSVAGTPNRLFSTCSAPETGRSKTPGPAARSRSRMR